MFGRLIKLVHYLALSGFIGGLAAAFVLGEWADTASTGATAAIRLAIVDLGERLIVPSLIAMLVSGVLLLVARPTLAYARWVWAKAALGGMTAVVVLAWLAPAERHAADLVREAALGSPPADDLSSVLADGQFGSAIVLVLVALAAVLAVWRPRLGRTTAQRSEGSDSGEQ